MLRVRLVQTNQVPVLRYIWNSETQSHVKTDEVIRVDTVERVIFSGSQDAFEIWKQSHKIPENTTTKMYPKTGPILHTWKKEYNPESFAQCATWLNSGSVTGGRAYFSAPK